MSSTHDANYQNVYRYFMHVSNSLLLGNIGTMQTHNTTLDVLTRSNQLLSEAWNTGAAGPDVLNGPYGLNNVLDKAPGSQEQADALNAFISEYFSSGSENFIQEYSTAVGAQLLNLVAQCYGKLGDGASADMSAVNSFNSVISAKSSYETQIGQNESKTEGSVVQQDTSAQQPIANCADSMEGLFGNVASLIQQTYS